MFTNILTLELLQVVLERFAHPILGAAVAEVWFGPTGLGRVAGDNLLPIPIPALALILTMVSMVCFRFVKVFLNCYTSLDHLLSEGNKEDGRLPR